MNKKESIEVTQKNIPCDIEVRFSVHSDLLQKVGTISEEKDAEGYYGIEDYHGETWFVHYCIVTHVKVLADKDHLESGWFRFESSDEVILSG